MTVCIGIKDKNNHCCYIGADCGVSHITFHTKTITPKVFRPYNRKDIVIGCAGSIRMANLLQTDKTMFDRLIAGENFYDDKFVTIIIETVIPKIKEYAETLKKDDAEFDIILAVKDRLYRIQSDCSVYEVEEMEIIGSGCETVESVEDYGFQHSKETITILKRLLKDMKKVMDVLHAYDWYVCGDTCEETFLKEANKYYKIKGENQ